MSIASAERHGPYNVATGPYSLTSNIYTVLSHPPDKRMLESSSQNFNENTLFPGPGSENPFSFIAMTYSLVSSSYNLTIVSFPAVAKFIPSGE
jgi:hypothetical protein